MSIQPERKSCGHVRSRSSHCSQRPSCKVLEVAQGLNLYDELMPITGPEAIATAQALARQEGIFTGISGRGLHSSTFRLNVSIFCGIRGISGGIQAVCRACLGVGRGYYGV